MPPPRIIKHLMNTTRLLTQTAVFVCVGQGYGLVDVSWVRIVNGDERSLREKSIVTTMVTPDNITTITSSLTIPDLENRDGRDYKCICSNSEGETSSYIASLTIIGKCYYILYHDNFHCITNIFYFISSSSCNNITSNAHESKQWIKCDF